MLDGTEVGTTTFNTTTGAGSFVCTFPDGPASSTVSVQVKDSDDADSNTATQTVTINNVAPTVTLSGATSGQRGSVNHTYSFTVTDPGADTFVLDATDCGANGTQVGSDTFNAATGRAVSTACSLTARPLDVVSVTVNDSDGASEHRHPDRTVNNVAPTVTLSVATSRSTRARQHTYSFTVSDPGAGHVRA